MNTADVLTLLRGRLGARGASNRILTYIVQELNAATLQLEQGPHWPWFLETTSTVAVTQSETSLPSDFLAEVEDRPVTYIDADSVEHDLEKRPYDELVAKRSFASSSSEQVKYYAMVGDASVALFPQPVDGSLKFYGYYASQPLLNSDGSVTGTNKWYVRAPFIVLNKAGYELAGKYMKDDALAQQFASDLKMAFQQLTAQSVQRDVARFEAHLEKIMLSSSSTR